MKRKIYILLLILCATWQSLAAQSGRLDPNLPKVVTPEVATLMKYINHPVDLAHGLAKIEIPLYELEFDGTKIPLSLSYHSSGYKVKEVNGNLAVGWSFNFAPSISRSINGMPDENGYLQNPGFNGWMDNFLLFNYWNALANGEREEDPDTFYYKLLGKSGKFYLNRESLTSPTRTPKAMTVPYEPVRIEYKYGNSPFKVWDDEGFVYDFNGSAIGMVAGNTINWKINEISSPRKKKLKFNYNSTPQLNYISFPGLTDYIAIEELNSFPIENYPYQSMTGCSDVQWPFITISNGSKDTYKINSYQNAQGQLTGTIGDRLFCDLDMSSPGGGGNTIVNEHLLQSFETDAVKIELVYTYAKDRLEGLNIIDKSTNEIIRRIRFTATRYNANDYQRMKLDKVEITDKNGEMIEKYEFSYYNPESTPNLINKNTDHWGYYNGNYVTGNQTSVPRQTVYLKAGTYPWDPELTMMQIGDAVKEPSLYSTRAGVLKSIKYPTGGTSTFEYELNRYESSVTGDESFVAGGLRIKSIKDYNPIDGKTITRTFTYGNNGGGKLRCQISLDNYKYKKRIFTGNPESGGGGFFSEITYYSSTPFVNLEYEGGSSVLYEFVEEKRIDSQNINSGFTRYEYTPDHTDRYQVPNTTIVIDRGYSWTAGRLKKKTDYKIEINEEWDIYAPEPIREEEYVYDIFRSNVIYTSKIYRSLLVRGSGSDPSGGEYFALRYNAFNQQHNSINTGGMRLVSETVSDFVDGNKTVVSRKAYQYRNTDHLYFTDITETNSNATSRLTNIKYPQDASYPSGSTEEAARLRLVENNQLNTPLIQTVTTNNVAWKNEIKYKIDNHALMPLPGSYHSGPSDNMREDIVIKEYYSSGKPAWITSAGKENTVYIWGYCGNYLIAEIKNATLAQVTSLISKSVLESISAKIIPSESDLQRINNLRQQLRNSQITTYTYKATGEPLTITSAANVKNIYDYDSAGRLAEIYYYENNDLSKKRIVDSYYYNYKN